MGQASLRVYSRSPWEEKVAYCRARRQGPLVVVSGTVAADQSGKVVGAGDMEAQARYIFAKIAKALHECGASLSDVARTRMFVTDITRFDEVAAAHKSVFDGIDPTATCVEVTRLVDSDFLVEIEVDAWVS